MKQIFPERSLVTVFEFRKTFYVITQRVMLRRFRRPDIGIDCRGLGTDRASGQFTTTIGNDQRPSPVARSSAGRR